MAFYEVTKKIDTSTRVGTIVEPDQSWKNLNKLIQNRFLLPRPDITSKLQADTENQKLYIGQRTKKE